MTQHSPYLEKRMKEDNWYCSMQVVFVDIASHSRRITSAQIKVILSLMRCIKDALSNTAREYSGYTEKKNIHIRANTVVMPTGDGAVIAFPFDGEPEMHLFFTSQLLQIVDEANKSSNCDDFREQGWCDCHDGFLLRCGASEGKVILYKDLNDNFNITGDVVNMASRVMDLADASQVFLTHSAYYQIYHAKAGIKAQFRKYTQARIKHDLRIDVYQYIDESVEGLNVSYKNGLGLADNAVESDDEVTPVESAPETTVSSGSKVLDGEGQSAGANSSVVVDGVVLVNNLRERMVRVPAGEFSMGNDRTGIFLVNITRPFLMDRFQITQAIYKEVMGHNPSRFIGDDLPVENISWIDAITFCNTLSKLSGLEPTYQIVEKEVKTNFEKNGYRLPTEAEWEYCCRGGSQEERSRPIDDIAWYNGNAGGQTHVVGTKAANSFGIYDMLGNVWEWCNDYYQRCYPKERQVDYVGPESGSKHVLRGGSWADLPACIQSSFRHGNNPLSRESTHGLRIVLREN